jgi:hypothetical protein
MKGGRATVIDSPAAHNSKMQTPKESLNVNKTKR